MQTYELYFIYSFCMCCLRVCMCVCVHACLSTQTLGRWKRPVPYLSKKLGPVAQGRPACLWITAAVALLVKDADKITRGQGLVIATPCSIEGTPENSPSQGLSKARLVHFQALLLHPPHITDNPLSALNPATLLTDPSSDGQHDGFIVLGHI